MFSFSLVSDLLSLYCITCFLLFWVVDSALFGCLLFHIVVVVNFNGLCEYYIMRKYVSCHSLSRNETNPTSFPPDLITSLKASCIA